VLQLDWIVEPSITAAPAAPESGPSTATRLTSADRQELLAIARRGEIAALRQRLASFRGDPLADVLIALAQSYRMERIRELLEQPAAD
jgi:hypothetical protein